MHFKTIALLCLIGFAPALLAQKKSDKKTTEPEKWDINNPPGAFKEVSFDLNEGTWMNLDVSPDGKNIVFDLLGDIYSMPITGGVATCLRSGYAYEVQPRFSPDGKWISFTSDSDGADNVWMMQTDGSNAKQITKEDFRLLNNAVWTPDGQYIIARKHFTNTRSAGAGELWMYHTNGGTGMQLTKRKNDQQDLGEPCVSKDGKYVYYSEDVYPGGYFQYNKDPNSQIYVIKRLNIEKGENETVVQGPGGAVRPVLSNNGKTLAYVRRVREKTVLYLRNLETGIERPIYTDLSKDQQEAWALFGPYTNYNFTPDDNALIIWAKGKIRKIDTQMGAMTEIPFSVTSKHKITNALHVPQLAAPDSFTSRAIRHAITSADGKLLIFNAIGYLWKKDLPNGKPVRLTKGLDFEFEPSFSFDGKSLVYVTWSDVNKGQIIQLNLGNNFTKVLSGKMAGIFRSPKLSPDGALLVYQKEEGNDHQGFTYCNDPGIYLMNTASGESKLISKEGDHAYFSADGKRIFYSKGGEIFGELEKAFKSCDLTGNDVRTHYTSKYASQYSLSPDNKWLTFSELFKVYVTPFIQTGMPLDLNNTSTAYPVKQIAQDAGISLHWSDNETMHWTTGEEYFSISLKECFPFLTGAAKEPKAPLSAGLKIGLQLAQDKSNGLKAFTNAKIITMNGEEVIENGSILIRNNRIEQVGKSESVSIPPDAEVVDCKGKTIMPGLVDVHAHLGTFRLGLSPQQQWQYFTNLAFGVTTTHDPSSNSEMVFSQSEMVKAGTMVGPRIFSTGVILYGADGDFRATINKPEDAMSALRRTKAWGAFSVKSYNQPRRNQRQMVIDGARKLSMEVVPEGGSHFLHNMTMILDGHTGIEHNIPVSDIYDDVVKLWSSSNTGYTPTLIVSYGAVNGEYYWYQKENVWENERLMNFTPRALVDSRARHRTMVPDGEYLNGHIQIAKSCKKLADAGVKVNLGAHGQIQGLGAHWELKMLASGGMSTMQALKCATVNGAYYIGMEKEIGSLEKGKLADFIILDKNPLDDIDYIGTIKFTVANGHIYDAMTMNEYGKNAKKRIPFYFEQEFGNSDFKWHEETHGFHGHNCGCRK